MAIYVIVALVAVAVTLLVSIPVTANISVKKKAEKQKKKISEPKMNLRRRPERDAMNFRSMRNVFYQKKKPLIRKQML